MNNERMSEGVERLEERVGVITENGATNGHAEYEHAQETEVNPSNVLVNEVQQKPTETDNEPQEEEVVQLETGQVEQIETEQLETEPQTERAQPSPQVQPETDHQSPSVQEAVQETVQQHKRTLDYTMFDPEQIQKQKQTRKVSSKLIDKFWEPLDNITERDFDKIIDISINKATERYGKSQVTSKIEEANELLSHTWTSNEHSRSFKSRLKMTKLPLKRTMHNSAPYNDENTHILNYDILNRRKAFLETHLSAELKQLAELQKTYNKIKVDYDSDVKYLNEFKRSIEDNKSKMSQTIQDKRSEFQLNGKKSDLRINQAQSFNFKFEEHDDDIRLKGLLNNINKNLQTLSDSSRPLLEFNEKLKSFQSDLDLK